MIQAIEDRAHRISALYQENSHTAAAFWEWQHKVITLFTASIGGLLLLAAWMYERELGRWLALPPAVASLVSLACAIFAGRVRAILNQTYMAGRMFETWLMEGLELGFDDPIFTWLDREPSTFRLLLTPAFWLFAILFLVIAVVVFFAPPTKASADSMAPASASVAIERPR